MTASSSKAWYKSALFEVAPSSAKQGSWMATTSDKGRLTSSYRGKLRERDITPLRSNLPQLQSGSTLLDAVWSMALCEAEENILADGSFMADSKQHPAQLHEIACASHMALALLFPDQCHNSLKKHTGPSGGLLTRVDKSEGRCNSDHISWALGFWELYLTTGDPKILNWGYHYLRASLLEAESIYRDNDSGLMFGESFSLSRRDQTYPNYFDDRAIGFSCALSTAALYTRAQHIAALAAELLKHPVKESAIWKVAATRTAHGIEENLWNASRGYYNYFRYPSIEKEILCSDRSEALGQALALLFDIPSQQRRSMLLQNLPVHEAGIPWLYPDQPGLHVHHAHATWPLVEGYRGWAAASHGNLCHFSHSLALNLWRCSMNLTHKEYYPLNNVDDSDVLGCIADRSLSSIAASLGLVLRGLFGISTSPEGIAIKPCVPQGLGGSLRLSEFKLRDCTLEIEVEGCGVCPTRIEMDGVEQEHAHVPYTLQGSHHVKITLDGGVPDAKRTFISDNAVAPDYPEPVMLRTLKPNESYSLVWNPPRDKSDVEEYIVISNGTEIGRTSSTMWSLQLHDAKAGRLYRVVAANSAGHHSTASLPAVETEVPLGRNPRCPEARITQWFNASDMQLFGGAKLSRDFDGFTQAGYVNFSRTGNIVRLELQWENAGPACISFRYASVSEKAVEKAVWINGRRQIVSSPTTLTWLRYLYSAPVEIALRQGRNIVEITHDEDIGKAEDHCLHLDCIGVGSEK
jgi:hypothetical protein